MTRCLLITFFVAALGASAAPLHIGRVTLDLQPLFDAEEARQGGFYRALNAVQIRSREATIRSMLLFREGDLFDAARLAETERNLRALDFLKTASVKSSPPHDGVVDVTVEVQDEFTTDVNGDFSNDGGRSIYDIDLNQKNLFGRAAEIDLRSAVLRERRTTSVEFLDPAFLRAYWYADALLAKNSDGDEERVSLERPLFSYAVRSTSLASLDHLLQNARIYGGGMVTSLFRQKHTRANAQFGTVVRSSPHLSTRILAGFDALDDRFTAVSGGAPSDRHFRFVEIGADTTGFRYLSMAHVDLGLREQDFNVGTHLSLFAAVSPGTRRVWRFRSDNSVGHAFSDTAFVVTRLTASMRAGATNRNALWSEDTRVVVESNASHPLTFVARARVDIGSDLDRDVQFFSDGQNGLRAYPNFAFEGNRRAALNAEERWFLGHEWFQLVEPGLAAFIDTGESVSERLALRSLRTDFGFGLRAGIARYESAMLRLDLAYALNDSPTSRRGFVISFATIQAF